MTYTIPPQFNEAVDGFLLIMLLFASCYFVFYLSREWSEIPPTVNRWRAFWSYENKTAFSLATLTIGLFLKEGSEWWWFHLHNHGQHEAWPVLVPILVGGAVIGGWGIMCLLRSLARYEWSRWVWIWMTIAAVAFGAGFAIY